MRYKLELCKVTEILQYGKYTSSYFIYCYVVFYCQPFYLINVQMCLYVNALYI
jgi:hypothetical protein